jgi:phospholipid/cholesterol/gamma-HCH transport system permease protein
MFNQGIHFSQGFVLRALKPASRHDNYDAQGKEAGCDTREDRTLAGRGGHEGAAMTASTELVSYVGGQLRGPLAMVGGFARMSLLTGKALFRWPLEWRELVVQCWFLLRVTILPTVMAAIPLTVLLTFTLNIVLAEFGAADISGAGAALGAVTQLGPLTTVLVVAGTGSTAICADLGARTIREEIDALEVMGIDPIRRLVLPRVLAATFVASLVNSLVIIVGLVGSFVFSVYLQHVSGGAFLSTLTLITGLPEVVIATVKAVSFGLIAGLVGCYRGLTVSGGAKGVGIAVNETVVLCVIALFAVNVILTTIGVRFGSGR